MEPIGIADIAARVGVSVTTVHFALRNTGRTSEATRQKVLRAARDLGYRPNRLARGLRTKQSSTLGVVVPGLKNSWVAHVVEGIQSAAGEGDYGVLLACSYGDQAQERAALEVLLERAVDGLIILPTDPLGDSTVFAGLLDEGRSLVFVDQAIPGLRAPSVSVDNVYGGYLAGRHLVRAGRRRIVFVANVSWMRRWPVADERLRGCAQAMEEACLPPPTVVGPGIPDVLPEERFAFEAVTEYFQAGGGADGLFAVNDVIACGALRALAARGLRVPEDVSVVGFDDQDVAAYLSPPLTTIRQPMHEIGQQAARLVMPGMHKESGPSQARRVLLEPSLVVRESCGWR